jgi:tetratricopeptide (TPR) repeat protein
MSSRNGTEVAANVAGVFGFVLALISLCLDCRDAKFRETLSEVQIEELLDSAQDLLVGQKGAPVVVQIEPADVVREADLELAKRKIDSAIILSHQESSRAYRLRVSYFEKTHNLEAALADANASYELDPDSSSGICTLVGVLRLRGELDKAETLIPKAFAKDPKNPCVPNTRGLLHLARERWGEAIADFEQAAAADPRHGYYYVNIAAAQEGARNYDAAIAAVRRAIEISPDFAPAHMQLGLLFSRKHQLAESEQALLEALRLRPDDPMAHRSMGNTLMALGRREEAFGHARKAISLSPNWSEPYALMGALLGEQGDVDESERQLNEALRLDENGAEIYRQKSLNALRRDEFEEAVTLAEKAVALDATAADCQSTLSTALLARATGSGALVRGEPLPTAGIFFMGNEMDRAFAAAQRAVQLDPLSAAFHQNLGTFYAMTNQPSAAAEQFAEALALDPAKIQSAAGLIDALGQSGQVGRGLEKARVLAAENPKLGHAQLVFARQLARSGQSDSARRQLARAIAVDPSLAAQADTLKAGIEVLIAECEAKRCGRRKAAR